ncbi:TPA: acyltransferase family protein [Vibrio diabolicus]
MKFRYDLNFLRAISVIGVIAYHFDFDMIPGGYIGVDVFFVLSGYLMTAIIFKDIEHNSFSYFLFCKRRYERIVPPLSLMLLFYLALNYFFAYDVMYHIQGLHGLSSLSFLSNIVYWQEANYFDTASKGKLFLHTWSLSVEWQFYLIFPLVILWLFKYCTIKVVKALIVIAMLTSLGLCIVYSPIYTSASFYLLPTRGWEMLVGAIAFLYNVELLKKSYLSVVGVCIIVGSMLVLDSSLLWPSALTIIPVIGTYLVLVSNSELKLYKFSFFYYAGLCSYSLYLWHWPLLSMRFNGLIEMNSLLMLAIIGLAGFFSYWHLERK